MGRATTYRMRSRNKFGNKKVSCDGITFDSIKEYNRYIELKFLLHSGKIKNLEIHKPFELRPSFRNAKTGKMERPERYYADFVYYDNERGETVVEDVKSTATAKDALYRSKKKRMAYQFGIYIEEIY